MSQRSLIPFCSLSFVLLSSCLFVSHVQALERSTDPRYHPSRPVARKPSVDPSLRRKAGASVASPNKKLLSASPSPAPSTPFKIPAHVPMPLRAFYVPMDSSVTPHQYDASLPKVAEGLFQIFQENYGFLGDNSADFEDAAVAHEADENRRKEISEAVESKASEAPRSPLLTFLQKEFGTHTSLKTPMEEAKQKLFLIVLGLQSYRDYGFEMLLSKEHGRSITHNLYLMAFGSLSNRLGGGIDFGHFPLRASGAAAASSGPFEGFEHEVVQTGADPKSGSLGFDPLASGTQTPLDDPLGAGNSLLQAYGFPDPNILTPQPSTALSSSDASSSSATAEPQPTALDEGSASSAGTASAVVSPVVDTSSEAASSPTKSPKDLMADFSTTSQIPMDLLTQVMALNEKQWALVKTLTSLFGSKSPFPSEFLSQLMQLTPQQWSSLGTVDRNLFV